MSGAGTVRSPSAPALTVGGVTRRRRREVALAVALIVLVLGLVAVVALGTGAVTIAPGDVARVLWDTVRGEPATGRDALVILNIRVPRLVIGLLVGAALAVSGAIMQGLFRNPLADPGLVGVSAGAGLAAAVVIVLGDQLIAPLIGGRLPFAALPFGAFFGGLATTLLLTAVATRGERTSIPILLLAGVALGALAGSGSGLLAFLSDDRQLRDLTFWSLGSLGGATGSKAVVVALILLPLLLLVPLIARALNALALGDAEAFHLGYPVQRVKLAAILMVSLAVGTSVAATGVIGFVGIVVPHVVRLLVGADHRVLLPLSALAGGALLVAADIVARVIVAPAELPIGIVTALIGAPFFLWLLMRERGWRSD
jgi:iron complex transport system permease protein